MAPHKTINKSSKIVIYKSSKIVIYKSSKIVIYQAPVLHGTALEVWDGDTVVLGQGVADAEVVLVERDGTGARVQCKLTLKNKKFKISYKQWKPLNVISENVIIRLVWPNLPGPQITVYWLLWISRKLLIVVIQLMLSLYLGPKLITLSSFRFNNKIYSSL